MEEKISKTRGCLFNEISFLLGLFFIKKFKNYLNIVFSNKEMFDFISLSLVIKSL